MNSSKQSTTTSRKQIIVDQSTQLLNAGRFVESLALLCAEISARPNFRHTLHEPFYRAYKALVDQLEPEGVFAAFRQAAAAFPDSHLLCNDMGARLHSWGFHGEAAVHFRQALHNDSTFLKARDNLDSVMNLLVERWHFRMLNDVTRNRAYAKAIERAVRKHGCKGVLDIGCGTGILSLVAVKAGAHHVIACDLSQTMCHVAEHVLQANGVRDQVRLVQSMSNDVQLTERVSLVVTEIVDAGLLGERIVPTLRHAWESLLVRPPSLSQVIPAGATVYACLVECEGIRKQSRLCSKLNASDKVFLIGSDYDELSESGQLAGEPYTTERLSEVRSGFRELSKEVRLFHIDFTNPKIALPEAVTVPVEVLHSGVIDAIVVWFTLHLDETENITTSWRSDGCWEQAIYPVTYPQLLEVKQGDEFHLHSVCEDTRIDVTVLREERMEEGQEKPDVFFVPRCDLVCLNDTVYQGELRKAVQILLEDFKEEPGMVLDFTQRFPSACLEAAKLGSLKCFLCNFDSRLSELIQNISTYSELDITIKSYNEVIKDIKPNSHHLVIFDPISQHGVFQDGILSEIHFIISSLQHKTGRLPSVFPQGIKVWAACIASPSLRANSQVLGSVPTLGFDIARFINKYQVTVQVDLNLTTLPHTLVTEPVEFLTLDFLSDYLSEDWDHYSKRSCVHALVSEDITSIAFWYEIHLAKDVVVTTKPSCLDFCQAAFLLPEDVHVSKGDQIEISFLLRDSCIDFQISS